MEKEEDLPEIVTAIAEPVLIFNYYRSPLSSLSEGKALAALDHTRLRALLVCWGERRKGGHLFLKENCHPRILHAHSFPPSACVLYSPF